MFPLTPANKEEYSFKFKRKQIPKYLCFTMTINKAGGQKLPIGWIYLHEHVFLNGRLYLALSRWVSMQTTKVLVKIENTKNKSRRIMCTKKFYCNQNIVF